MSGSEVDTHRYRFRDAFNHLLQTPEEMQTEAGMVSARWTDAQKQMARLFLEELGIPEWHPDHFLSSLEADHREAVLKFRDVVAEEIRSSLEKGEIREEDAAFARDLSTLRRYLVARDFNFDKSLKLLQGSLKWRAKMVSLPPNCDGLWPKHIYLLLETRVIILFIV